MRKPKVASPAKWVELEKDELQQYASAVRRVCIGCGQESWLTVSPPVWAGDVFSTQCLRRDGQFDRCDGTTIVVRESWKLMRMEMKPRGGK